MLLTQASIKWRASVFVLMIVFTLFGISSYNNMPKEANPDVPIPFIMVSTVYMGVSPEDMENLVTLKIENELRGIEGVKKIESFSAEGVSNISIEFQPNVNLDSALQRVKDKVDLSQRNLPDDLTEDPIVSQFSTSDFPVFVVALSGNVPEADLKVVADEIKDNFETITGVLKVELSGARDREIQVIFDYERLQAYQLTINQIAERINQEHINIPGGSIDIGKGKYLLKIPGEYKDPYDIKDLIIAVEDKKPIYLRDVAKIIDTFEDQDTYARLNREQAISISVTKRPGANILNMVDTLKKEIELAEKIYPPALKFTITTDFSKDIRTMVNELENHLVTGLILVILVLFFFLGKVNSIFTAIAIPFSMLMSFIVLNSLDITLNMMVLFSITLALGMLVDDAIVIVENTYRHMQLGKSRIQASIDASKEVGWPIIASTLTKIFAFLPMIFWPGIIGEYMKFLPLTLVITLSASLFVALVFNPVVCATFMKVNPKHLRKTDDNSEFGKFMQFYIKSVDVALNHRFITLIISIAFLFLPIGLFMVSGLGFEFFPSSDPKRAFIKADAPQGTNAETTLEMVKKFEQIASEEKNIKLMLAEVGGSAADFSDLGGTATHKGRLTIEFVDFEERTEPSTVTLNKIREKLNPFPGADVIIDKEEMGPPTGDPVSVEISGKDVTVLGKIAADVRNKIYNIQGLVDLKDDYVKSKPEIKIDVDREKAALLGLSTYAVADSVRSAIYGKEVAKFREYDEEYDIKIRLDEKNRKTIDDVKNLSIGTPSGDYVPLSSIANVSLSAGFGTITRVNFKRVVNVTGDVQGRSSVEVMKDVANILKDYKLPPGYKIDYTGETEEQQEASKFLTQAFTLAIFLILMTLLIEFNSVSQTLIILATVLLSIGGIFWGLLITQTNFGIMMTGIGAISLAGVVVNNAIILIDYTNKLIESGMKKRDAIIRAGAVRFRPVMLTAWTAILGMIPMSTGFGINIREFTIEHGAEMSQFWGPMANAVIFGLAFATMLTLIIVPVLYSFTGGGLGEDSDKPKWYKRLFNKFNSVSLRKL